MHRNLRVRVETESSIYFVTPLEIEGSLIRIRLASTASKQSGLLLFSVWYKASQSYSNNKIGLAISESADANIYQEVVNTTYPHSPPVSRYQKYSIRSDIIVPMYGINRTLLGMNIIEIPLERPEIEFASPAILPPQSYHYF